MFDHCSFKQLGTGGGIIARNCWFFLFNECFLHCSGSGDAISSQFVENPSVPEFGNFAGLWTVSNSLIDDAANGIRWTGGAVVNLVVRDTAIQNCTSYGFYGDAGSIQTLTLDNAYFENVDYSGVSFIKSDDTAIEKLYMQSCFMLGGGNDEGSDTFTSNGTTQTFTYTFDSPSATSDIVVTKNGTKLTETTDYTVNLGAQQVQVQGSAVSNGDTIIVKKGVATAKLTGPHIDLGRPSSVDINNTRVFRPPTKFLHIANETSGNVHNSIGQVRNTTFVHDALTFDNYTTPIYLVTTGSGVALPRLEHNIISGDPGISDTSATFQLYDSSTETIKDLQDIRSGVTSIPKLGIGEIGGQTIETNIFPSFVSNTFQEYTVTTTDTDNSRNWRVYMPDDERTMEGRVFVLKNSSSSTESFDVRNQQPFTAITSIAPGESGFFVAQIDRSGNDVTEADPSALKFELFARVSESAGAADAIVDGDFTSNGLMKRTGAGTYTTVTDNSANWLVKNAQNSITHGGSVAFDFTNSNGPLGLRFSAGKATSAQVDMVYRTTPETLQFERVSDGNDILMMDPSDLSVTIGGTVTWSGGGSANANTAYGWGDHSTQNYAVTTGDTFTGNITIDNSAPALRLDDSTTNSYSEIKYDGNDFLIDVDANTNGNGSEIVVKIDTTEQMRMDSLQRIAIGNIAYNGNGGLTINSPDSTTFAGGLTTRLSFNRAVTGSTSSEVLRFRENGSNVGVISYTNTAVTYGGQSDARLKKNITDAPSASADIDAIQVRSFDWKVDDSHQKYGFIAQELVEIEPLAVSGEPDGEEMMMVDNSKLIPMMIKEIQELRARVAELEASS